MTIRGLLTCLMDMSGSIKVITLYMFWKSDLDTTKRGTDSLLAPSTYKVMTHGKYGLGQVRKKEASFIFRAWPSFYHGSFVQA